MLCSLARSGFKIDVLRFGMDVIYDVIGLTSELSTPDDGEEYVDLSSGFAEMIEE